jgi:hypothetical protein
VIGRDTAVVTPFGLRRVTYADYTASGRSLTFIEDYIRSHVLPMYANTHTETSGTGLQTTRFREEASDIVRRCVGATRDEHAVIFAGSGSTGAIDRLITILGLAHPGRARRPLPPHRPDPAEERPVVFVGPYEHHSNELPWRESIADVVEIAEDADGHIDLGDLERASSSTRIARCGSVPSRLRPTSPASSPTPRHLVAPAPSRRAQLLGLRRAAPYVGIEMRSPGDPRRRLQGRRLHLPAQVHRGSGDPRRPRRPRTSSPTGCHRCPVAAPCLRQPRGAPLPDRPRAPRGGRHPGHHRVDPLRTRLQAEGAGRDRDSSANGRSHSSGAPSPRGARSRTSGSSATRGRSAVDRVVRRPPRRPPPPPQLRRGAAQRPLRDPGPGRLLVCRAVRPPAARHRPRHQPPLRGGDRQGCEVIKPGWVRVNFNYFIDEDEFDYIVEAVRLVARLGWALLPRYSSKSEQGTWRHRDGVPTPPMSLADIDVHTLAVPRRADDRRNRFLPRVPRRSRAHPRSRRPRRP